MLKKTRKRAKTILNFTFEEGTCVKKLFFGRILYYNNKISAAKYTARRMQRAGKGKGEAMPSNKVKFTICGSSYVVSTNDSEEYMLSIAERLDTDMKEMMQSTPSASVTSAAIVTALEYLDDSIKNSFTADNMRAQLQEYLEDAAQARLAAEDARQEAAKLRAELANCKEQADKDQKTPADTAQALPPVQPPPPVPAKRPEAVAAPVPAETEEAYVEKPYPGQIRLEEL